MPLKPATIVWFRSDLRLADNAALLAAVERAGPVLPVFIWSPEAKSDRAPGGASRWWLHHSLAALGGRLQERGSRLIIRQGRALDVIRQLSRETGATAVLWNDCYEPAVFQSDSRIKAALGSDGIEAESTSGALLYEPWAIQNNAARPYRVFTPFWKACLATGSPPAPLPSVDKLPAPRIWPASSALEALPLLPPKDWAGGLREAWNPGERGAWANLVSFMATGLADYDRLRNFPAHAGTSRLSPHLHFGEISPRQVWHACLKNAVRESYRSPQRSQFFAELGWREFAHHLLFHFPETTNASFRHEFSNFPWHENAEFLCAWQRGQTGYPIVDAGMRQLWATGWMHNRVRMVVGSFLVKDLLIDWRRGAEWFRDTLVDADLANNTLGWQWVAGCGADAAPYFRVFSPVAQGEKFDPQGDYVRRWVPELAGLPAKWIHKPFDAPSAILREAGVDLGRTYPAPLVSHAAARLVALGAYRRSRKSA